uniref:antirestriction protein ArdA n=1 Tax=Candidatus Enterococcus willemsii TaxID=1857215 RepID=UPI00403F291E
MDNVLQVYITNLSQFEYDELIIGAWFTLPVSADEIREKLLMTADDTFEIEDWVSPVYLTGDHDLTYLNQLALLIEENAHHPAFPYVDEMIELGLFDSLTECVAHCSTVQHVTEKPTDPVLLNQTYELYDGTYLIT